MPGQSLLPSLNPFLPYLADSVRFLNRAVDARACQDSVRDGWMSSLCRASALHAIGAVHAALQAAIYFEDADCDESWPLRQKAELYLAARASLPVELPDEDLVIFQELEQIASVLSFPQIRQAESFPSATNPNLIQFARTPLKKISLEATTWVAPYSACVLAMALGVLRRLFRKYTKIPADQRAVYFGDHAHNSDGYSTRLNPNSKLVLIEEIGRLRDNQSFMRELQEARWRLDPDLFNVDFIPGL